MIPWWSTDFGEPEIHAVAAAINGRHISQGKITCQFEDALAERLGVPYVVCTTSGTTALTMALLAAGIGRGDEVVVPNRTWIATAHAVMMTGATVALADVEKYRPCIDVVGMKRAITRKTRALMPVHLNGRQCGMLQINTIARGHRLLVIEDACQSFPFAPRGDMACYSLSTAKIIATGQGGFVATLDEGAYKELKALRTHDVEDAMVPQVLQWRRFGYNFRFTDIQAAIGLAQLARLEGRIVRLREIHAQYAAAIPVLHSELPLYNELLHPDPESLRAHLQTHGIEARPFYPSLHTALYLNAQGEFQNSEKFKNGLILPSGPTQSTENIQKVIEAIHSFKGAENVAATGTA